MFVVNTNTRYKSNYGRMAESRNSSEHSHSYIEQDGAGFRNNHLSRLHSVVLLFIQFRPTRWLSANGH